MHFEHRFTAPNEKNACIRPQRGYTCTYMVLPGSFETPLLCLIISKKSNTEIAWINTCKASYRLYLYNLSFIFSKNTIIYNSMFFIVITNILNECFNYHKIFCILCVHHIGITGNVSTIFATLWTYVNISILARSKAHIGQDGPT